MNLPISRYGPHGRIPGRSRGIFQMSDVPPLTFQRLEVYADGAIRHNSRCAACDFGTFERKLTRDEIDVAPGPQVCLSEHGPLGAGLGTLTLGDFQPKATKQDVIDWAASVIAELNPDRVGLNDFHGQEVTHSVQPREGVTMRTLKAVKISGAQFERRGHDGSQIAGKPLRVVHRRSGEWLIDDLIVYVDGRAQLGADGAVEDLCDIAEHFRCGQISSVVPDGEWIGFPGLGRLKPSRAEWMIVPEDLFAEAEDVLARLQGKSGCAAFCLAALKAYEAAPDAETFDILKSAYEWTPAHRRFEDLDGRENVIRAYLGLPRVFDYGDYAPMAGPSMPKPRADLVRPVK